MTTQLALYKGPPKKDITHLAGHYGIKLWTRKPWSHAELVIDGVAYSSSARDGGVRPKVIDFNTGRWDLVDLPLTPEEESYALLWFHEREHWKYDYWNIGRFVFPIINHDRDRVVCFEAVASALRLPAAHKFDAGDLFEYAQILLATRHPAATFHDEDL